MLTKKMCQHLKWVEAEGMYNKSVGAIVIFVNIMLILTWYGKESLPHEIWHSHRGNAED
jgi:hypothetical protein